MKRVLVQLCLVCLVGVGSGSAVWADGPTASALACEGGGKAIPCETDIAAAGQNHSAKLDDCDPFRAGAWSVEFHSGYYVKSGWGPNGKVGVNPPLDYLPEALRIGLMCNDPITDWCVPIGVAEVLLEYDYNPVIRGVGSYFTGPNALLRYNLVLPGWALVPYGQAGAGFVFNDAWKDHTQRIIGQEFEFLLRVEGGVHVMLTESVSLDVEGGYQHISNACLAPRNMGLNSLGATVGLTLYYGR